MKTFCHLIMTSALLSTLIGCGEHNGATSSAGNQGGKSPTFEVSPESAEFRAVADEARGKLVARDWDGIDSLANKYRTSKDALPDGLWKLEAVYQGLQIEYTATGEQWEGHIKALTEYAKAKPNSISARVAVADNFVRLAWKARGGGTAQTVTQIGWKLFGERLRQASATLENARKLDQKCPYFWNVLLDVARGLSYEKPQFERLYVEASQLYPNHATHTTLKLQYLLPRWNGVPGELEAFLASSVSKMNSEEGDVYYAQVCWHFQNLRSIRNAFRESRLSWERADRGYAALEKRFPSSVRLKNIRAFMAVMGGSPEAAKEAVKNLGGQIDLAIWESPERFQTTVSTLGGRNTEQ